MNEFERIMKTIIDSKYEEVLARRIEGPFDKIIHFEGNAVGQIGEAFVKKAFEECGIRINDTPNTVHDEYDVKIRDTKIEVKTARRGANGTFQFNGLNPRYNADFIIFVGISPIKLYFKVISKDAIHYVHSDRSYYCQIDGSTRRKLVAMNPGNDVNYKLTLTSVCLDDIDDLSNELVRIATFANS